MFSPVKSMSLNFVQQRSTKNRFLFAFCCFSLLGIDPRALCLLGRYCTTEPHPLLLFLFSLFLRQGMLSEAGLVLAK